MKTKELKVYGDDGSDEKKDRVVAVAVAIGTNEMWGELEPKWISRCDGIPFHAKDCESDQGLYKGVPHAVNKAMYRDLTTLLAESRAMGIGIAMDLVAQKKVFPGSLLPPYYRAFAECIVRSSHFAKLVGTVAEVTFDISSENEFNAGLIYSGIRHSDPQHRKWLAPRISFGQSRECARLQTADMLAYEAWKALDHTVGAIKRERRSWLALRATGRFETISYSEDWFSSLKQKLEDGEIKEAKAFTESDYLKWLSDSKRQHNISNLFSFVNLANSGKYRKKVDTTTKKIKIPLPKKEALSLLLEIKPTDDRPRDGTSAKQKTKKKSGRLRSAKGAPGPFPPSEAMQREDRKR